MNIIVPLVKWLSILAGFASYVNLLPSSVQEWALLAFVAISALKDTVIKVGDKLDDGKINDSYKG